MKKKDIAMSVILSIITCGIYSLVWFIQLTNDVAQLADDKELSGGKAFLFTLLTCGIYGIYWGYRIGEDIKKVRTSRNLTVEDTSTIYFILMLCSYFCGVTGLVMYCLAQKEVNELIGE